MRAILTVGIGLPIIHPNGQSPNSRRDKENRRSERWKASWSEKVSRGDWAEGHTLAKILAALQRCSARAGFIPNELDKQGYGKAGLLDFYAKLALELGRLPTTSDLQFKDFNDAEFPSRTTFEKGIGTKTEIANQLITHLENQSGFEPVIALCKAYVSEKQDTQETFQAKPNESLEGYVYLAKAGKFFKIGKTNAPGRRDYELAIQLPEKLVMVHIIRTDDPEGIEAYWHKRFSAKRQNGEWFSLKPEDVAAFKRRKFM